jgi:hypothetical protein
MCAMLDLIVSGPRLWNDLKREVKFNLLRLSSSFQFLFECAIFWGVRHISQILGVHGTCWNLEFSKPKADLTPRFLCS